jgi:hypothetical protein
VADDRLLEREAQAASLATCLALQRQLVRAVVPPEEQVPVVIEREPVEIDAGAAIEHSIGERDTAFREHFAQSACEPLVARAAAAVRLVQSLVRRSRIEERVRKVPSAIRIDEPPDQEVLIASPGRRVLAAVHAEEGGEEREAPAVRARRSQRRR